jgi:hypothetical protein
MGKNRLFIPQDTLDQWVDEARAVVTDDELTLVNEARVYRLASAVQFLREATGANDPHDLVGKVKDQAQLTILGADAYMDSVILEDNAYDVRRGFVAIPALAPTRSTTIPPPAEPARRPSRPSESVELPPEMPEVAASPAIAPDPSSSGVPDIVDEPPVYTPEDVGASEAATGAQPPPGGGETPEEDDDELARLLLKSLK